MKIKILLFIFFSLWLNVYAENYDSKNTIRKILRNNSTEMFIALKGAAENNETLIFKNDKASQQQIFALLLQKVDIEVLLKNEKFNLNTSILIDSCDLNNDFQDKRIIEAVCRSDIQQLRNLAQMILTPLQATCLTGDLRAMKMLIKAGANINGSSSAELRPIEACLATKKINQVDFLLDEGTNANGTNLVLSPLALLSWLYTSGASDSNSAAITTLAKKMLRNGSDPHFRNKFGGSELHFAAAAGNLAIVKLLVELGVDINVKDNEGMTPLGRAVKNNKAAVVDYLISVGALK